MLARAHTRRYLNLGTCAGGGSNDGAFALQSTKERRGDKWRHSCYRCKTLWLSLRYGLRNARVSATLEHGTTEAATAALSLLRHIDPGSPCAQPSGEKCSTRRAAPASHLPCRHGGGRGGHAAARAHQYGWVAALRAATSDTDASAAQRPSGASRRAPLRKQGQGQEIGSGIGLECVGVRVGGCAARQPPPRRWRGARVPIGCSSSTAAAHRATGGWRQRSGGTPARVLLPSADVRSGGAIGVGRAAAAWQQAAKRRAAPNQHLVVDSCGGYSPAARHGLGIRHKLASDAASGRIGRR